MDLTWYGLVRRHLLIGRGMKRLWRSHDAYPGPRSGDVGAIALGRHALAFNFSEGRKSRLFLAPYGGRELVIAAGEIPLEFTGSGALVTWRERGGALFLRSENGRLIRRLAVRAIEPQVERESRMVLFRSAGHLFAFDGVRVRSLGALDKLGVTGVPVVEPLGRLIAVHDRRRLVVVDYEGRVFASTPVPRKRGFADGVSSPVIANADGTSVAYTATHYAPGVTRPCTCSARASARQGHSSRRASTGSTSPAAAAAVPGSRGRASGFSMPMPSNGRRSSIPPGKRRQSSSET